MLTRSALNIALGFLLRTQLTGAEVPAYNEVTRALNDELDALDEFNLRPLPPTSPDTGGLPLTLNTEEFRRDAVRDDTAAPYGHGVRAPAPPPIEDPYTPPPATDQPNPVVSAPAPAPAPLPWTPPDPTI